MLSGTTGPRRSQSELLISSVSQYTISPSFPIAKLALARAPRRAPGFGTSLNAAAAQPRARQARGIRSESDIRNDFTDEVPVEKLFEDFEVSLAHAVRPLPD